MARKKLTPEEKAERARQRMIKKACEYQIGTYCRKFVAPVFQLMVRAEAAAEALGKVPACVDGVIVSVWRNVGKCVCVTCGKVGYWKGNKLGGGEIETGHYLAGRKASIVLEETNAHPQCKRCNQHLGGNQGHYEIYMQHIYGQEEIDRLRLLKNQVVKFERDELVDLRIFYQYRLDAAIQAMTVQEGTDG